MIFPYLSESQETKTQTYMDSWSLDGSLRPHLKKEEFHITSAKMSVNKSPNQWPTPGTDVGDFPQHLTVTICQ